MLASLTTGVSGLRTHQLMLEVVGNNLANLNTTSFKSSRVLFSDMLSETLRAATSASASTGGTNAIQRGLGVQASSIDVNDSQGTLETTGRNLDLAISGDGYFVANNGAKDVYTRVGTFSIGSDGKLVHSATGYRVLDMHGREIAIPANTRLAGNPTSQISVTGNLDAAGHPPYAEQLTSRNAFLEGGSAATAATLLNALDDTATPYADGDLITISGTTAAGDAVSGAFTYGAGNDGTTLGELQAYISGLFGDATCSVDANGNVLLTADATGEATLALALDDDGGQLSWENHVFNETTTGSSGSMWETSVTVFDSQGQTHILALMFEKMAANTWDMTATLPGSDGVLLDARVSGIRFNEDGSFAQISGTGEGDSGITLQFPGVGEQEVTIDFGTPGDFSGLTQFGGNFSAAPTWQDGYESGTLDTVSVRTDGVIQGTFTNGLVSDIATLQIAMFANPGGLLNIGDGFFSRSPNSGLPAPGQAGMNGAGELRSGTLESSNVDVAYEFTRLIVAQRGFQVNSRTITVSDEVLQELAQLMR